MAHSRKHRSHKKSHSHKKSRSHGKKHRSHKKSRSHKKRSPRIHRLTKSQFRKMKLDECSRRSSQDNCDSDPNCSWNTEGSYCYKGKRNIYAGPSLEIAY